MRSPREAGGAPCLNPRRGLTGVPRGEDTGRNIARDDASRTDDAAAPDGHAAADRHIARDPAVVLDGDGAGVFPVGGRTVRLAVDVDDRTTKPRVIV